jgi:hypothetical protein
VRYVITVRCDKYIRAILPKIDSCIMEIKLLFSKLVIFVPAFKLGCLKAEGIPLRLGARTRLMMP